MLVKELRDALANMPGEMNVYAVNGHGIASALHVFRGNLIGVEQFCELRTFFEDHTPQFEDILIERETGFKNRRELLDAFKALRDSDGSGEADETRSGSTEGDSAGPKGIAQPPSFPQPPSSGAHK